LKYFLALLLVIVLVAGGAAAWIWYGITKPYQGFAPGGVFVDVPHGASQRYVAYLLQKNGVVQSALAIRIYARQHPKRTLQAGEYFFDHAMAGRDVFWKLANGEVFQQPFTVREGETMFDIARDLEAGKFMRAGDFLYAAGDPALIRDFAPGAQTLEGFLFPATYELPRHPAASELTAEMVHKFKEEWRRIGSPVAGGPADEGDHRAVRQRRSDQERRAGNFVRTDQYDFECRYQLRSPGARPHDSNRSVRLQSVHDHSKSIGWKPDPAWHQ